MRSGVNPTAPAPTPSPAPVAAATPAPTPAPAREASAAGGDPAQPARPRKPRSAASPRPAQAPKPARAPQPQRARDSEPPPSSPPDSSPASSRADDGDGDSDGDDFESDATTELVEPAEEEFTESEENTESGPSSYAPASSRAEEVDESKLALSRNDPLQAYLREVQRHPLLTPDEEQTLAQRYAATQDVDAAARLVTANLRLVVKIAYEYRRAYKNIMDLIQEGNIGLMQAVKKYDPNRGVKLSSYSAWWIRAYILRYIINNWRLVKLGTTQAQRKLFFNLNKEKAKLSAMGIDPTPERIAKNLGVEEQEAIEMERRLSSGEMSLDAPVGDNEGRPVSRIELLASGMAGPDSAVAEGEMSEIVHEKLLEFRARLKGKDLDIFDKRLVADEPLTLQELGDQFGISRERVRQIEARLTTNLRTFLTEALGDAVER